MFADNMCTSLALDCRRVVFTNLRFAVFRFEDSFHNLQRRTGDEIKYGKLNVKFYDEEGVDAGGVTRYVDLILLLLLLLETRN